MQNKSMSMLTSSVAGASWLCLSWHRKKARDRGRRKERRELVMKKTDEGINRKKEGDRHQPTVD